MPENNSPYFDMDAMYASGFRAKDMPKNPIEDKPKKKVSQRRKKGDLPKDRPTIYEPSTGKTYKKYSKEHFLSTVPKERPSIGQDEAPIPLTDRDFDEAYFETQGNPNLINPLLETARAKLGREKVFEDMFYISYDNRDELSDDDKKEWEAVKKTYNKNIYGAAQESKSQAIKHYNMLKGYNTQQRQRFDIYKKQQESDRRYFTSKRQTLEKELFSLDKEAGRNMCEAGSTEAICKAIRKRKKQVERDLGGLPGGAREKEKIIVETRMWKGREVHKYDDGSIVFADGQGEG